MRLIKDSVNKSIKNDEPNIADLMLKADKELFELKISTTNKDALRDYRNEKSGVLIQEAKLSQQSLIYSKRGWEVFEADIAKSARFNAHGHRGVSESVAITYVRANEIGKTMATTSLRDTHIAKKQDFVNWKNELSELNGYSSLLKNRKPD